MLKTENASRYVFYTLFFSFLVKIALSQFIPVTGDEAYYAIWGIIPAWGGYDHTPFIGWLLYPFLKISHQQIILRLPTVLATSIMGWVIYLYGRNQDKINAALASILFLISPITLCGVIITTDTPVILFSFLSGICVLKAIEKKNHYGWFVLAGLSLGLAFFSKYFAVLLALAYAIYFLAIRPSKKGIIGLFIMFLCVLPFGLENIYWNYTHAWANILFNVYNRNVDEHFSLMTVFYYVLTLFYIITPPLFYYLFKHPRVLFQKTALSIFILVPLIFFLILSVHKSIGMHWPLAFVMFVYVWAGIYLTRQELTSALKFMVGFTGLHLLLIVAILLTPMRMLQQLPISHYFYTKLVFFFEHKKIRDSLNQYNDNYVFTSFNYVQADMMFYDSGLYAPTFGEGSVHGRQDDFITDFKTLAHKNMLIFYTAKPDPNDYKRYFAKTRIYTLEVDGATFYYVLADNFNYPVYRDTVLRFVNDTYWQVPAYLPHAPSFFEERYFPTEPSK